MAARHRRCAARPMAASAFQHRQRTRALSRDLAELLALPRSDQEFGRYQEKSREREGRRQPSRIRDEDPEIHRTFLAEVEASGAECLMCDYFPKCPKKCETEGAPFSRKREKGSFASANDGRGSSTADKSPTFSRITWRYAISIMNDGIEYRARIVVFIDVLGFSELVGSSEVDATVSVEAHPTNRYEQIIRAGSRRFFGLCRGRFFL